MARWRYWRTFQARIITKRWSKSQWIPFPTPFNTLINFYKLYLRNYKCGCGGGVGIFSLKCQRLVFEVKILFCCKCNHNTHTLKWFWMHLFAWKILIFTHNLIRKMTRKWWKNDNRMFALWWKGRKATKNKRAICVYVNVYVYVYL